MPEAVQVWFALKNINQYFNINRDLRQPEGGKAEMARQGGFHGQARSGMQRRKRHFALSPQSAPVFSEGRSPGSSSHYPPKLSTPTGLSEPGNLSSSTTDLMDNPARPFLLNRSPAASGRASGPSRRSSRRRPSTGRRGGG